MSHSSKLSRLKNKIIVFSLSHSPLQNSYSILIQFSCQLYENQVVEYFFKSYLSNFENIIFSNDSIESSPSSFFKILISTLANPVPRKNQVNLSQG